jgi:23S rRNA U2552 (ribose-2'-O)-methylase RlmE/FtsJ
MTSFILPSIPLSNNLIENICPQYINNKNTDVFINKTLLIYLNNIKTEIDNRQTEWDKFKKYTNPYEYIHTLVPNSQQSVCKLKPLSRSFYKMIEIFNMMNIEEILSDNCKTFHLAEGPGGFIEAICHIRQNINDMYYGMTLINDDDTNIPGWKKSKKFLANNKNVYIETGKDGTGNLMNAENLRYVYLKYHGQMELITGDGGFDFSIDFNNQEPVSAKLIFCQIAFAIATQKKGGCFIIKFFDTFTEMSVDMIFFLSQLYETIDFVKPNTSRYANSEKYIVCKNFKLNNTELIIKHLFKIIQNFPEDDVMIKLFKFEIPIFFKTVIEEINAVIGQQQIESISTTLNLIDNNKYDRLTAMKKNNIQKCISWCTNHQLPCNKVISQTNIFLNKNK